MESWMNPFVAASAKGAAWLLVWSWQAAVLLACVWAGLKIFRVKSPALRHQVWLFALIADEEVVKVINVITAAGGRPVRFPKQ